MDGVSIGFLSIGVTLVIQLCAGIWWAATITEKLRQLGEALLEIKNDTKKRLDQFIEDNEKTHKLIWGKQDDLRNRITVIETRCFNYHNGVKHETVSNS